MVRETTAAYEHQADDGTIQTDEIRVRYYSISVADVKRQQAANAAKIAAGETLWFSELLAERLESLPDILDEKGKPIEITAENLENIDLQNLEAIRTAIDNDLSPKLRPQK